MFLKVYKGGIVSLQGASFSRKSKKWSGNKLGLLVLMMDEGSVMERAYFTVVPLLFWEAYLSHNSKCALSF